MEILTKREHIHRIEYYHDFSWINEDGSLSDSGFGFPCEKDGTIKPFEYEEAKKNYEFCLNNPDKVYDKGIIEDSWDYYEPATGKCSCGNIVTLEDQYQGACECSKCGRWYNLFGQELINPKYWGDDDY